MRPVLAVFLAAALGLPAATFPLNWCQGALKVDRQSLFLPVAKAHRFRPVAATQFDGQIGRLGRLAAFLGLGQGALCRGGQVKIVVGHGFTLVALLI